jgi:hypothetical protein
MGGMGALLLAFVYALVDWQRVWTGRPFSFVGMNSIALYIGSEILGDRFPFTFAFPDNTHSWYLMMSLLCVTSWIVVAWCLKASDMFFVI